ncbi:uncharacterized [Tachysurus ichikawai]
MNRKQPLTTDFKSPEKFAESEADSDALNPAGDKTRPGVGCLRSLAYGCRGSTKEKETAPQRKLASLPSYQFGSLDTSGGFQRLAQ